MLVLSRKPNQKINIGSEITITVVKVRGNVIRLGIEAPRDIRVVRGELELKVDDALTAGIMVSEDAATESVEEASDEPSPRQSQVTIARYTPPLGARGLASVMTKPQREGEAGEAPAEPFTRGERLVRCG